MTNDRYGLTTASRKLLESSDPFATYSNQIYPKTVKEVFDWATWLWLRHGIYSQAIRRSVRYFLHRIELSGEELGYQTRVSYERTLTEQYSLLDLLAAIGDDLVGFGNSFTSVTLPIERNLLCPECGTLRALRNMPEDAWQFVNFEFTGKCVVCGKKTTFQRSDARSPDDTALLNIVRWPHQHMAIDHNPVTGESEYYYNIPGELAARISNGDPLMLRSTPWPFIAAVRDKVPLHMNKDTFKHLRTEACAQLTGTLCGFGLPPFMSNFSLVVQLQVLEKFNEAIADSAIAPLRVLSPAASPTGVDPLRSFNGAGFATAVRSMLVEHKKNPTGWHMLPVPLAYNAYGGDAKSLVPVELIDRALDNLLTSMGVPQELYRSSFASHGPPQGMLMFERSWRPFTGTLEGWGNWFLQRCRNLLLWRNCSMRLVSPAVYDDDMGKQVKLNLASARIISNGTAMRAFGLDPDYERERRRSEETEEEEFTAEEAARREKGSMLSEYMIAAPPGAIPPNASQANMGMPPGGEMPPGGPGQLPPMPPGAPGSAAPQTGNPSVDDLMAQAQEIAGQLLAAPPNVRRSELTNMKRDNPTLHAMVKQELANMEQGIKSDALAQAKQPQP